MTLNGVMAVILRYFAEFDSFRGRLVIKRFFPDECHEVHPKHDRRAVLFAVAELVVLL